MQAQAQVTTYMNPGDVNWQTFHIYIRITDFEYKLQIQGEEKSQA